MASNYTLLEEIGTFYIIIITETKVVVMNLFGGNLSDNCKSLTYHIINTIKNYKIVSFYNKMYFVICKLLQRYIKYIYCVRIGGVMKIFF